MKQIDLQSVRRPSVSLIMIDELIRPGRARFQSLPTVRYLWRGYEPIILAKPQSPKTLQTRHDHLTIGTIGAGRFIKPVEELIAWTIERGRLNTNPVLRTVLAKTSLLGRTCHLVFFSQPRELVFHAIIAIANMAAAQGIEQIVLHPVGVPDDMIAQIMQHAAGTRLGTLTEIENFDTVISINVAPYTNEYWLDQFLNARPDLTDLSAVVLAGEPSHNERYLRAFPTISYDGTLAEAILASEHSHQRTFPNSQHPHLPYYFDGLRTMQLGVQDQVVANVDELAQAFDRALANPSHFNVFSIDSTMVKPAMFDRLLGRFVVPYFNAGGSLILVSGIQDPGPMLSGVIADRALAKDLVSSAFADNYGLASVGRPQGAISDIAPTVLKLLGLPIPVQMTGRSLV
ncbi:hypothetical protein HYZ64_02205 [Candidatus Berkelbacteria bacterium]|nr:hypothetical protein [Candidatus Berkelbacteria bacterium]